MIQLYIAGPSNYANWLLADNPDIEITCDLKMADLGFFTGGEDVSPSLYNQQAHHTVGYNPKRDEREVELFNYFKNNQIPMIGVCRGSQFLCVMNGGQLVQHSSHPYLHDIKLFDGSTIQVNSTHHQQALLTNLKEGTDYELLGWAEKLSQFHFGPKNDYKFPSSYREPEITWYKKTYSLGIQGHPEMLFDDDKKHIFVETVQKFAKDTVLACIPAKV